MKLTDLTCKNAKPDAKRYKKFDGGGLCLLVNPNGTKLWRLKYRYLRKEKMLCFGAYPFISLSEARDQRENAKRLLAQNPSVDPAASKKDAIRNATLACENTFKIVTLDWIETNKEYWSERYLEKIEKILKKNVYPVIGHRPISKITAHELLKDCIKKIENRGSLDIASRTRQICSQIFRYGIQTSRCELNPAEHLKGAIKRRHTKHYRTLNASDLPEFLKCLERNEARIYERTRRAVWLSLYTFCRPGEIRQARWRDIDFKKGLWIIPAEMIKMRRDHIVPLCEQTTELLNKQKAELENLNTEWVFPNQFNFREPMSDGTVNKAICRLGYGQEMVAHGVRALARTLIREELGYDSEVIEKQLAHKTKNPLGEAYDRTDFLKQRYMRMSEWAK